MAAPRTVGFTGTQGGMTPAQKATFERELQAHVAQCGGVDKVHFLHGACVGADEDAALIAQKVGLTTIVSYPGHSSSGDTDKQSKAALAASTDNTRKSRPYRARNTAIVQDAQVMYAAPPCRPMPSRGGTLMTYNIAVRHARPTAIIWPDGTITVKE